MFEDSGALWPIIDILLKAIGWIAWLIALVWAVAGITFFPRLKVVDVRGCEKSYFPTARFLKSCSKLLKKNGLMFVATINKTLKSYIFAIVGAEYVLRWLPIGTHEWEKFVKPEELKSILIKNNLNLKKIDGMNFNILKDEWNVSKDLSVNYIAEFKKN